MVNSLARPETQTKQRYLQQLHQKEYRPKFNKLMLVIYAVIGLCCFFTFQIAADASYKIPYAAGFGLLMCLFGILLFRLFHLGASDHQSYMHRCIEACEDETELAEMGFDNYEAIKMIVYQDLVGDGMADTAAHPFMKELHAQYDLRKIADQMEAAK